MNQISSDTTLIEPTNPSPTTSTDEQWDLVITPRKSLLDLNLREVWRYRDLLLLFVQRNVVAEYKQTILGPIWYFLQPLFTTLIFTIIFGRLAGITNLSNSVGIAQ